MELFAGIMIPFAGTALGAACVFFLKHEMKPLVQRSLLGFASGVMVAAAVWSLLIPAMDMSEAMGKFAFIPGAVGFLLGILFLLGMDKLIPHLHIGASQPEGKKSSLKKTTMLVLAVTLHNIPEGMAVGVVFAGMLAENTEITLAGAMALSVGIAIQNFPEGAIISLPLRSEKGESISLRGAFRCGGAFRGFSHRASVSFCAAGAAVSAGFCRRRHDLCGGGRTDTGSQPGRTQQYRNHWVCGRLCIDDDIGCGIGIKYF